MPQKIPVKIASEPRKKAMVVSHERSGTHFLMNTLALNFGYIAQPWINFDFELGLNFHSARGLARFFAQMDGQSVLNIVKTHHQHGFFAPFLDRLLEQFHVFYVIRDPRDVMVSFWRYIAGLDWDEGPKTATVGEFMRAAPSGAMMRYQKTQVPSVLERWRVHVEAWSALARPRGGVVLVRYEDLNRRFEETVARIGADIGMTCPAPERPSPDKNVIHPSPGVVGAHAEHFTPDDHDFVHRVAGDLLERWWAESAVEA